MEVPHFSHTIGAVAANKSACIYQEAIVSSLAGLESEFAEALVQGNGKKKAGLIDTLLRQTIQNKKDVNTPSLGWTVAVKGRSFAVISCMS